MCLLDFGIGGFCICKMLHKITVLYMVYEYAVLHAKNIFGNDKTKGKWVRFFFVYKVTVLQFGLYTAIF